MMSVKQIKEVRMMRQEGLPIREICRKAGISRNTVRKILRGQQARFKYDRQACIQPAQDSIKEILETWNSVRGRRANSTGATLKQ